MSWKAAVVSSVQSSGWFGRAVAIMALSGCSMLAQWGTNR